MKYIASIGDGEYISGVFWLSDTSPIIALVTTSIEHAIRFDSKDKEEAFASKYPNVQFLPIMYSVK